MDIEHLVLFAADLQEHAGLKVDLQFDTASDGLHVLTVNGTEFFFYANGSGYDGWGRNLTKGGSGC